MGIQYNNLMGIARRTVHGPVNAVEFDRDKVQYELAGRLKSFWNLLSRNIDGHVFVGDVIEHDGNVILTIDEVISYWSFTDQEWENHA